MKIDLNDLLNDANYILQILIFSCIYFDKVKNIWLIWKLEWHFILRRREYSCDIYSLCLQINQFLESVSVDSIEKNQNKFIMKIDLNDLLNDVNYIL
jgi:chemotaxis regulatin CheY-phosphate phosphatase CheZ